jgi:hypothetical protein
MNFFKALTFVASLLLITYAIMKTMKQLLPLLLLVIPSVALSDEIADRYAKNVQSYLDTHSEDECVVFGWYTKVFSDRIEVSGYIHVKPVRLVSMRSYTNAQGDYHPSVPAQIETSSGFIYKGELYQWELGDGHSVSMVDDKYSGSDGEITIDLKVP